MTVVTTVLHKQLINYATILKFGMACMSAEREREDSATITEQASSMTLDYLLLECVDRRRFFCTRIPAAQGVPEAFELSLILLCQVTVRHDMVH